MTKEDIECIIKWFSHIEQLATDGKTANGFQMPPDKILATIKVVAKDSREYVEKFCNESVPNDLEEAKEAYCDEHNDDCFDATGDRCPHIARAFLAGAKWQEERDQETIELAEDHAFLAGSEWQKEQMMRDAVEGEVCIPNVWVEHKEGKELVVRAEISKELGFKFGDKVRMIVIPNTDKK